MPPPEQQQQSSTRQPQSPSGFPNSAQIITFDGYKGLNTRPARPAIDPDECYILENWMPLGKSNLRTMYDVGPALYSTSPTVYIFAFGFANIATTPYLVTFLTDGSVDYAIPGTTTTGVIAPPGTVSVSSPLSIGVSQYGNQYILIAAEQTNGYFLWDGTNLYKPGTLGPDVYINNNGLGYTSPPTMVAVSGGTGAGATFAATVQNGTISSITVVNPGSGYQYADAGYIAFSGGGCAGSTAAYVGVINTLGAIASCNVVVVTAGTVTTTCYGAGYPTATSFGVTAVGGGGGGATLLAYTNGAGSVTSVGLTSATSSGLTGGGQGYTSAPAIYIENSNNPVATARIEIMPFGIKGSALETFQGHVWVGDGNRVIFTAPSSAANFGPPDGGGAFQSTDSFLRVGFTGLRQSNGFLYLFGDSSVNTVSNVTTTSPSSGIPITQFSNNNIDPQIGTPWPNTIQVFSRNIVFANTAGVHVSYGGAVVKISGALDKIFASLTLPANFYPSAALANIFGVNCYIILLPVPDPVTGEITTKLFIWDSKVWFSATQSVNLIMIASQEINSQLSAWGTDGTSIYQLFVTPSTTLVKTIQSKLWDDPGYFVTKAARRLYGLVYYFNNNNGDLTITIDNGLGYTQSVTVNPSSFLSWPGSGAPNVPYSWTGLDGLPMPWVESGALTWTNKYSPTEGPMVWFNSSLALMDWTNASGPALAWWGGGAGAALSWTNQYGTLVWQAPGNAVFGPIAMSQAGQLMGLTLRTQAEDMALLSLTLINQAFALNV